MRLLKWRDDLAGDRPRVAGDWTSGGALEAPARVGAAVKAPARGALVDAPQANLARLQQALGEPVGLVDLVGKRRTIDAPVGDPPGGCAAAGALARSGDLSAGGCLLERGRKVDVLVELLELVGARLLAGLLQRVLRTRR